MSGIINSAGSKSGVIGQTELDYEEGAWTPTYRASAYIAGSVLIDLGYYVRIGNFVQCWCRCYGSSGFDSGYQESRWSFDLPFTRQVNNGINIGGIGAAFHGSGANRISQGQILDGGGDTDRTIYYLRQNEIPSTHGSPVYHRLSFQYLTDQYNINL